MPFSLAGRPTGAMTEGTSRRLVRVGPSGSRAAGPPVNPATYQMSGWIGDLTILWKLEAGSTSLIFGARRSAIREDGGPIPPFSRAHNVLVNMIFWTNYHVLI